MRPQLRLDNVFSVAGFVAVFLSILVSSSFSNGAEQHRAGKATGQQLKMKAIWQPVNYGEDLQLTSVHFSTPDTGWVTGEAGTILYPNDAGKTWEAQLGGDPQASDRPIVALCFVDANHGFAVQSTSGGDHKLLATPTVRIGSNLERSRNTAPAISSSAPRPASRPPASRFSGRPTPAGPGNPCIAVPSRRRWMD